MISRFPSNPHPSSSPGRPTQPLCPLTKPQPAPAPQKEDHATAAARISAYVRNNLLASPEFPRLYADVVISSAPNSNEAKILARNYKKIVERVNADLANADRPKTSRTHTDSTHTDPTNTDPTNTDPTNNERTNRTQMSNVKNCTHIKVTGVRCGSPALRGEQFCYFHQRMIRTVKGPPASRVHHAALLEDEESIQTSLMEVVNALLRGSIEIKRAELILRALNTAVRNIRRVNFTHVSRMITQVPEYPAVPDLEVEEAARAEAARQATHAEIARVRAAHLAPVNVQTVAMTDLCGDGTATRPGGPELPGRSALSAKENAALDPTRPKPPVSDKSAQILQSRKHLAPSG